MHEAGIDYPGHTEILAERSGTDDFAMMLANDELRVLLVTIHVALADVMARITPEAELTAMRLADRACRQMSIAHPRVADVYKRQGNRRSALPNPAFPPRRTRPAPGAASGRAQARRTPPRPRC